MQNIHVIWKAIHSSITVCKICYYPKLVMVKLKSEWKIKTKFQSIFFGCCFCVYVSKLFIPSWMSIPIWSLCFQAFFLENIYKIFTLPFYFLHFFRWFHKLLTYLRCFMERKKIIFLIIQHLQINFIGDKKVWSSLCKLNCHIYFNVFIKYSSIQGVLAIENLLFKHFSCGCLFQKNKHIEHS